MKMVNIIGGGLAGLSLGLGLRRAGVPVVVHEAGQYPRQRVCGEFIAGLSEKTVTRLGIGSFLDQSVAYHELSWFDARGLLRRQRLPEPAWCISRHVLDAHLAEKFIEAGGELRLRTRVDPAVAGEGWVNAAGRRRSSEAWMGLKLHVRGLVLDRELELHLGRAAYVGLCRLSDGEVNIAGLFPKLGVSEGNRLATLLAHLRACGLDALAQRLETAEFCPGSDAAVAGLGFKREFAPGKICLGDASGMLPPLFGNGMAAAFQMAEEAIEPLTAWSHGKASWMQAADAVEQRLRRRFRTRFTLGPFLQSWVLVPWKQTGLRLLARGHCLPLGGLYRLLH